MIYSASFSRKFRRSFWRCARLFGDYLGFILRGFRGENYSTSKREHSKNYIFIIKHSFKQSQVGFTHPFFLFLSFHEEPHIRASGGPFPAHFYTFSLHFLTNLEAKTRPKLPKQNPQKVKNKKGNLMKP